MTEEVIKPQVSDADKRQRDLFVDRVGAIYGPMEEIKDDRMNTDQFLASFKEKVKNQPNPYDEIAKTLVDKADGGGFVADEYKKSMEDGSRVPVKEEKFKRTDKDTAFNFPSTKLATKDSLQPIGNWYTPGPGLPSYLPEAQKSFPENVDYLSPSYYQSLGRAPSMGVNARQKTNYLPDEPFSPAPAGDEEIIIVPKREIGVQSERPHPKFNTAVNNTRPTTYMSSMTEPVPDYDYGGRNLPVKISEPFRETYTVPIKSISYVKIPERDYVRNSEEQTRDVYFGDEEDQVPNIENSKVKQRPLTPNNYKIVDLYSSKAAKGTILTNTNNNYGPQPVRNEMSSNYIFVSSSSATNQHSSHEPLPDYNQYQQSTKFESETNPMVRRTDQTNRGQTAPGSALLESIPNKIERVNFEKGPDYSVAQYFREEEGLGTVKATREMVTYNNQEDPKLESNGSGLMGRPITNYNLPNDPKYYTATITYYHHSTEDLPPGGIIYSQQPHPRGIQQQQPIGYSQSLTYPDNIGGLRGDPNFSRNSQQSQYMNSESPTTYRAVIQESRTTGGYPTDTIDSANFDTSAPAGYTTVKGGYPIPSNKNDPHFYGSSMDSGYGRGGELSPPVSPIGVPFDQSQRYAYTDGKRYFRSEETRFPGAAVAAVPFIAGGAAAYPRGEQVQYQTRDANYRPQNYGYGQPDSRSGYGGSVQLIDNRKDTSLNVIPGSLDIPNQPIVPPGATLLTREGYVTGKPDDVRYYSPIVTTLPSQPVYTRDDNLRTTTVSPDAYRDTTQRYDSSNKGKYIAAGTGLGLAAGAAAATTFDHPSQQQQQYYRSDSASNLRRKPSMKDKIQDSVRDVKDKIKGLVGGGSYHPDSNLVQRPNEDYYSNPSSKVVRRDDNNNNNYYPPSDYYNTGPSRPPIPNQSIPMTISPSGDEQFNNYNNNQSSEYPDNRNRYVGGAVAAMGVGAATGATLTNLSTPALHKKSMGEKMEEGVRDIKDKVMAPFHHHDQSNLPEGSYPYAHHKESLKDKIADTFHDAKEKLKTPFDQHHPNEPPSSYTDPRYINYPDSSYTDGKLIYDRNGNLIPPPFISAGPPTRGLAKYDSDGKIIGTPEFIPETRVVQSVPIVKPDFQPPASDQKMFSEWGNFQQDPLPPKDPSFLQQNSVNDVNVIAPTPYYKVIPPPPHTVVPLTGDLNKPVLISTTTPPSNIDFKGYETDHHHVKWGGPPLAAAAAGTGIMVGGGLAAGSTTISRQPILTNDDYPSDLILTKSPERKSITEKIGDSLHNLKEKITGKEHHDQPPYSGSNHPDYYATTPKVSEIGRDVSYVPHKVVPKDSFEEYRDHTRKYPENKEGFQPSSSDVTQYRDRDDRDNYHSKFYDKEGSQQLDNYYPPGALIGGTLATGAATAIGSKTTRNVNLPTDDVIPPPLLLHKEESLTEKIGDGLREAKEKITAPFKHHDQHPSDIETHNQNLLHHADRPSIKDKITDKYHDVKDKMSNFEKDKLTPPHESNIHDTHHGVSLKDKISDKIEDVKHKFSSHDSTYNANHELDKSQMLKSSVPVSGTPITFSDHPYQPPNYSYAYDYKPAALTAGGAVLGGTALGLGVNAIHKQQPYEGAGTYYNTTLPDTSVLKYPETTSLSTSHKISDTIHDMKNKITAPFKSDQEVTTQDHHVAQHHPSLKDKISDKYHEVIDKVTGHPHSESSHVVNTTDRGDRNNMFIDKSGFNSDLQGRTTPNYAPVAAGALVGTGAAIGTHYLNRDPRFHDSEFVDKPKELSGIEANRRQLTPAQVFDVKPVVSSSNTSFSDKIAGSYHEVKDKIMAPFSGEDRRTTTVDSHTKSNQPIENLHFDRQYNPDSKVIGGTIGAAHGMPQHGGQRFENVPNNNYMDHPTSSSINKAYPVSHYEYHYDPITGKLISSPAQGVSNQQQQSSSSSDYNKSRPRSPSRKSLKEKIGDSLKDIKDKIKGGGGPHATTSTTGEQYPSYISQQQPGAIQQANINRSPYATGAALTAGAGVIGAGAGHMYNRAKEVREGETTVVSNSGSIQPYYNANYSDTNFSPTPIASTTLNHPYHHHADTVGATAGVVGGRYGTSPTSYSDTRYRSQSPPHVTTPLPTSSLQRTPSGRWLVGPSTAYIPDYPDHMGSHQFHHDRYDRFGDFPLITTAQSIPYDPRFAGAYGYGVIPQDTSVTVPTTKPKEKTSIFDSFRSKSKDNKNSTTTTVYDKSRGGGDNRYGLLAGAGAAAGAAGAAAYSSGWKKGNNQTVYVDQTSRQPIPTGYTTTTLIRNDNLPQGYYSDGRGVQPQSLDYRPISGTDYKGGRSEIISVNDGRPGTAIIGGGYASPSPSSDTRTITTYHSAVDDRPTLMDRGRQPVAVNERLVGTNGYKYAPVSPYYTSKDDNLYSRSISPPYNTSGPYRGISGPGSSFRSRSYTPLSRFVVLDKGADLRAHDPYWGTDFYKEVLAGKFNDPDSAFPHLKYLPPEERGFPRTTSASSFFSGQGASHRGGDYYQTYTSSKGGPTGSSGYAYPGYKSDSKGFTPQGQYSQQQQYHEEDDYADAEIDKRSAERSSAVRSYQNKFSPDENNGGYNDHQVKYSVNTIPSSYISSHGRSQTEKDQQLPFHGSNNAKNNEKTIINGNKTTTQALVPVLKDEIVPVLKDEIIPISKLQQHETHIVKERTMLDKSSTEKIPPRSSVIIPLSDESQLYKKATAKVGTTTTGGVIIPLSDDTELYKKATGKGTTTIAAASENLKVSSKNKLTSSETLADQFSPKVKKKSSLLGIKPKKIFNKLRESLSIDRGDEKVTVPTSITSPTLNRVTATDMQSSSNRNAAALAVAMGAVGSGTVLAASATNAASATPKSVPISIPSSSSQLQSDSNQVSASNKSADYYSNNRIGGGGGDSISPLTTVKGKGKLIQSPITGSYNYFDSRNVPHQDIISKSSGGFKDALFAEHALDIMGKEPNKEYEIVTGPELIDRLNESNLTPNTIYPPNSPNNSFVQGTGKLSDVGGKSPHMINKSFQSSTTEIPWAPPTVSGKGRKIRYDYVDQYGRSHQDLKDTKLQDSVFRENIPRGKNVSDYPNVTCTAQSYYKSVTALTHTKPSSFKLIPSSFIPSDRVLITNDDDEAYKDRKPISEHIDSTEFKSCPCEGPNHSCHPEQVTTGGGDASNFPKERTTISSNLPEERVIVSLEDDEENRKAREYELATGHISTSRSSLIVNDNLPLISRLPTTSNGKTDQEFNKKKVSRPTTDVLKDKFNDFKENLKKSLTPKPSSVTSLSSTTAELVKGEPISSISNGTILGMTTLAVGASVLAASASSSKLNRNELMNINRNRLLDERIDNYASDIINDSESDISRIAHNTDRIRLPDKTEKNSQYQKPFDPWNNNKKENDETKESNQFAPPNSQEGVVHLVGKSNLPVVLVTTGTLISLPNPEKLDIKPPVFKKKSSFTKFFSGALNKKSQEKPTKATEESHDSVTTSTDNEHQNQSTITSSILPQTKNIGMMPTEDYATSNFISTSTISSFQPNLKGGVNLSNDYPASIKTTTDYTSPLMTSEDEMYGDTNIKRDPKFQDSIFTTTKIESCEKSTWIQGGSGLTKTSEFPKLTKQHDPDYMYRKDIGGTQTHTDIKTGINDSEDQESPYTTRNMKNYLFSPLAGVVGGSALFLQPSLNKDQQQIPNSTVASDLLKYPSRISNEEFKDSMFSAAITAPSSSSSSMISSIEMSQSNRKLDNDDNGNMLNNDLVSFSFHPGDDKPKSIFESENPNTSSKFTENLNKYLFTSPATTTTTTSKENFETSSTILKTPSSEALPRKLLNKDKTSSFQRFFSPPKRKLTSSSNDASTVAMGTSTAITSSSKPVLAAVETSVLNPFDSGKTGELGKNESNVPLHHVCSLDDGHDDIRLETNTIFLPAARDTKDNDDSEFSQNLNRYLFNNNSPPTSSTFNSSASTQLRENTENPNGPNVQFSDTNNNYVKPNDDMPTVSTKSSKLSVGFQKFFKKPKISSTTSSDESALSSSFGNLKPTIIDDVVTSSSCDTSPISFISTSNRDNNNNNLTSNSTITTLGQFNTVTTIPPSSNVFKVTSDVAPKLISSYVNTSKSLDKSVNMLLPKDAYVINPNRFSQIAGRTTTGGHEGTADNLINSSEKPLKIAIATGGKNSPSHYYNNKTKIEEPSLFSGNDSSPSSSPDGGGKTSSSSPYAFYHGTKGDTGYETEEYMKPFPQRNTPYSPVSSNVAHYLTDNNNNNDDGNITNSTRNILHSKSPESRENNTRKDDTLSPTIPPTVDGSSASNTDSSKRKKKKKKKFWLYDLFAGSATVNTEQAPLNLFESKTVKGIAISNIDENFHKVTSSPTTFISSSPNFALSTISSPHVRYNNFISTATSSDTLGHVTPKYDLNLTKHPLTSSLGTDYISQKFGNSGMNNFKSQPDISSNGFTTTSPRGATAYRSSNYFKEIPSNKGYLPKSSPTNDDDLLDGYHTDHEIKSTKYQQLYLNELRYLEHILLTNKLKFIILLLAVIVFLSMCFTSQNLIL